MKIQAEISVYPLGQHDLTAQIENFVRWLECPGLTLEIGPLSTLVTGESTVLFDALEQAYALIAENGRCVLLVKIIN